MTMGKSSQKFLSRNQVFKYFLWIHTLDWLFLSLPVVAKVSGDVDGSEVTNLLHKQNISF